MTPYTGDPSMITRSMLRECADCETKVTCADEREEFDYEYLCDSCYERRKEDLESDHKQDEENETLFI